MRPLKNPLLTRYWLEFAPPVDPPGYHRCWPPGRCGVTAYSLDDALWLVREHVFEGEPLPPLRHVVEDMDLCDPAFRVTLQGPRGAPVWRGVWYPHRSYDCWRPDIASWPTNPSTRDRTTGRGEG